MSSAKLLTPGGGGVILQPASSIASDVTVNVPVSGVNGGTLVSTDASGNVGIGTSSPSSALYVKRTSGNAALYVDYNGTNVGRIEAATNGNLYIGTTTGSGSVFIGNTANASAASIDSSGNLLVGTTSNTHGGASHKMSIYYPGGGNLYGLALRAAADNTVAISFVGAANTTVGTITISSSGTTAYNTSSDYRLKSTPRRLVNALDRVMQLNPCEWDWLADGSQGVGFIAHEVQAIRPQAVTGEKDAVGKDGKPIYQGMDASFLIADLTAAIQEQQAMIQTLQAEVADLKSKVQA